MNPPCDTIRELLAAEYGTSRPWSEPLETHLQDCGECAQRARRMQGCVQLLDVLEPVEAPRELDGRVVSACHAGFTQSRATRCLSRLEPLKALASLDVGMEALFSELREEGMFDPRPAPEQLEARLQEDLGDLPKSLSKRFVDKLPRLQAPGNLRQRVDEGLAATSTPATRRSGLLSPRPTLLLASAAVAAGLVWILALQNFSGEASQVQEPLELSFEVLRPIDLDGLSSRASNLAALVSGGLDPSLEGLNPLPVDSANAARLTLGRRQAAGSSTAATSRQVSSGGNRGSLSSSSSGSLAGTSSGIAGSPGGSSYNGPTYFAGIHNAPFEVAYRGIREVTIRTQVLGVSNEVIYQEEAACDGNGAFALVPRTMITPIMTQGAQEEYFMRQESREGFFYRYRDFRIRQDSRFWMNYQVQDLGQATVVAGRNCETFQIQRADGTGNIFEVAIDPLTSLIMDERCTRQDGELVSRMEFLTFDLSASLLDLQLNSGQSAWTQVDQSGLTAALAHEALLPSAPPIGYELQELGYRTAPGAGGSQWAQLTYGDGVEQTFFLFEDSLSSPNNGGSTQGIKHTAPDLVRAYSFGPWNMLEGHVSGRYVLSVGRVSEGQLLLMLQSALE